MFNIQLWGGKGNKKAVAVSDNQELCTIASPFPPLATQKAKPFRQYFTVDGEADGSNDMGIDGSATNVDFFIPAHPTEDRYITYLHFILAYGSSGSPFQWADGTALTNGVRVFHSSAFGEQDIHDGIKSNQDMFRIVFDAITSAWQIRGVNANNDYGYFIGMDISRLGLPYGVKLDRGTNQKLVIRIRDNVGLAADTFNCIAYGFNRFE